MSIVAQAALADFTERAAELPAVQLHCAALCDEHLPGLLTAMHHSQCMLRELDLSFNRLTDAGVETLVEALCRKINTGSFGEPCALELTKLRLGGNELTPLATETVGRLASVRPEVCVDFEPRLADATPLCNVEAVHPGSPAERAGLLPGDKIIALGPMTIPEATTEQGRMRQRAGGTAKERELKQLRVFRTVVDSVVPLLQSHVGKLVDVVVTRATGGGSGESHVKLALTPQKWAGSGLLGCRLLEAVKPE